MKQNLPLRCSVLSAILRGVNEFITITCPHCGEGFEIPFDPNEGNAEFVVDCEVCCRPMTVGIRVRNEKIEEVHVTAS
jgi:ribosomal protein S27E